MKMCWYLLATKETLPNERFFMRHDLLVRLRCNAQIRTWRGVTLWILLLDDFFILDRQRDDDVVAVFPVTWCCDGVAVCQLQRIQHAQHFVEVAAGAHRVSDDEAHLLLRIDDEERTDRRCF